MLHGLDSETPPTPAAAAQAKAAGFGIWSGYLATRGYVRIARPWSYAEFQVARTVGTTPIAYCSGLDDAAACRALAALWSVRLCLDVESSIRPDDGTWSVQDWLDASGAGLYGNQPVHHYRAAFHVLAAYPASGDPLDASWASAGRPPGPCGWQYSNLGHVGGIGCDLTWFDDWFAGTAQGDDPMIDVFTYKNPTTGQVATYASQGAFFWWLVNDQAVADVLARRGAQKWPGFPTPIADLNAMGVPANSTSAHQAGTNFP